MATSKIKNIINVLTESLTFNSDGEASTSLPRKGNVIVSAIDTGDWDIYVPWTNNNKTYWGLKNIKNSNATRTVKIFYIVGGGS